MNISVLIAGIIVGAVASCIATVFLMRSLKSRETKKIAGSAILLLFGLCLTIASVAKTMHIADPEVSGQAGSGSEATGKYNSKEQLQARQIFIDTLKLYVNENLKNQVPADFYTDHPLPAPINGKISLPFLYPFEIHYNPDNSLGDIANDAADSVYLKNISKLAFDQNFVIASVDNTHDKTVSKDENAGIEYVLFDLRTREYLSFTSMNELLEKSGKIGYAGPTQMNSLTEDYRGWIDIPGHD